MTEEKKISTIEELPGVGPTSAQKLRSGGFNSLEAIAVAPVGVLVDVAGLGEATASKVVNAARDALEMGYESADILLEKRKEIGKLSTGSQALNDLLGGGIETQSITEFYGAFGSSKTQIAHQLAVICQRPVDQGGLDGNALMIDTETTFRPERIVQMAEHLGMDPKETLSNIFVAKAYNSDHQMLLAEKADGIIKEKNIKLVIVDSLTSRFRSEYMGRGMLADRQQKLNKHLHTLQKLAQMHNTVVMVTNQVMSNPAIMFGDPTYPIGGHIVGHTATFRLYLRRSKETKRVAKLVDSPNLPDGEAIFKITNNGVEDV